MAVDIFWSPSSQGANRYAYGNTNERDVCNSIADRCDYHAKRHGYTTARNDRTKKYDDHRKQSNGLGPRYHIAIHTNARDGKTRGISVYCYRSEEANRSSTKLAQSILNELVSIPGAPRNQGLKQDRFDEIINAKADVAYPEIDYHDNPEGAKWILNNIENIAVAIVKGILARDNKQWTPEVSVDQTAALKAEVAALKLQNDQLHQQLGAANSAQAQMLRDLQAAGTAMKALRAALDKY